MDFPAVTIEGKVCRRVVRCEESYVSAVGPVRLMRSLYRSGGGTRTRCPMELRAGIVEGRWTPLAARQAAFVVAHLTPQEGEDLFRELGNMSPSKSSLDRLPKQLGERWEAERARFEGKLCTQASVHHGHQTPLPEHYVARERLCLRATIDYWVNALDGQPFFVINQAVDPGLLRVLENEIVPRLEKEVPAPSR